MVVWMKPRTLTCGNVRSAVQVSMELLFTRPSFTTKRKTFITPTYYLFRGSIVKKLETTDENKSSNFIDVTSSAVLRFTQQERILYLNAFKWEDIENCNQELVDFVRKFSQCKHLWATKLQWPYGRESLLGILPRLPHTKNKPFQKYLLLWMKNNLQNFARSKSLPEKVYTYSSVELLNYLNGIASKSNLMHTRIRMSILQFLDRFLEVAYTTG